MILFLPFSLPDATPIGDRYAMQTRDGFTYYFFNLEPFDCHPADDRRAMLLRVARLHVVSGVRQADIMCASTSRAPPWHAPSNAIESRRRRLFRAAPGAWAYRRRRRDGRQGRQTARFRDQRQRLRSATRHSGEHLPRKPSRRRLRCPRRGTCRRRGRSAGGCGHRSPRQRGRSAGGCGHHHPANASHTDPAAATDRASRDARDKQAPMGRALVTSRAACSPAPA